MEATEMIKRVAAATLISGLAACGGGGGNSIADAGASDPATPTDPAPASTPYGSLTLSGSGVDGVGVGDRYTPDSPAPMVQVTGPSCTATGNCSSMIRLFWYTPGTQFSVTLLSEGVASPGAAAGTDVNHIDISLAPGVIGASGLSYGCSQTADCNLAAHGLTLDTAARTLTFDHTTLPNGAAAGQPEVVLSGTLTY